MCKLIVGINKKKNNKEFEKYIEAQQSEMSSEKDGCAGLVITFDNKVHVFRELDDYVAVWRNVFELLPNAKLVSIHTRTGTSGQKNLTNVHFFENDGHLLAHNGFVMKYHSSGHLYDSQFGWNKQTDFYNSKILHGEGTEEDERIVFELNDTCRGCSSSKKGICKKHHKEVGKDKSEKCDSFQFLENLTKPISASSLAKDAETKEFSGMGIVVKKSLSPEIYLIIKKDVKLQTDKDTFGIFYSYTPDKESKLQSAVKLWGVDVVSFNTIKTDLPIRSAFSGVYKLPI